MRATLYTSAILGVLGCTPQSPELAQRPADTPDVLILSVSGHCPPIMGLCDGNFNPENLSYAGTLDAVTTPLIDAGFEVESRSFVDGWYTWVDTEGEPLATGFVDLVATLELTFLAWMNGFEDPTRIVLIGHGHGVVWTHLAAQAAPHVPVEVLVDLDGMSAGWDDEDGYFGVGDDWPRLIPDYLAADEQTWLIEEWRAEDHWTVSGVAEPQDIEDVVPSHVVLNLEVQSTPNDFQVESGVFDGDPNHRAEGGTRDIRLFTSSGDHYGVYDAGTDSMDWVASQTLEAIEDATRAR